MNGGGGGGREEREEEGKKKGASQSRVLFVGKWVATNVNMG